MKSVGYLSRVVAVLPQVGNISPELVCHKPADQVQTSLPFPSSATPINRTNLVPAVLLDHDRVPYVLLAVTTI